MDISNVLNNFGFDWRLFVFNLINFIVIAFLFNKFVFKKILDIIEERRRIIDEGIRNADEAEMLLNKAKAKEIEIITEAKIKSDEILKKAEAGAKDLTEKIINDTNLKLEEIRAKSQERLEKDKVRMMQEFKYQAGDLIVKATRKVTSNPKINFEEMDTTKIIESVE